MILFDSCLHQSFSTYFFWILILMMEQSSTLRGLNVTFLITHGKKILHSSWIYIPLAIRIQYKSSRKDECCTRIECNYIASSTMLLYRPRSSIHFAILVVSDCYYSDLFMSHHNIFFCRMLVSYRFIRRVQWSFVKLFSSSKTMMKAVAQQSVSFFFFVFFFESAKIYSVVDMFSKNGVYSLAPAILGSFYI